MLDKIRTRGHWELVFRPLPFKQRVTSSVELQGIVEKAALEFAGWRFPFVKDRDRDLKNGRRQREADWIGQLHQWEHHLEVWRFYTSGQFVVTTSVSEDWRDQSGWWPVKPGENWQPNVRIGVAHITQMLLQIFLFCSRLSESAVGDEKLQIEIVLKPTEGRRLYSDFPRRMLHEFYKADIAEVRLRSELSRVELLTKTDDLVAASSERIFKEFGFQPSPTIMKEFVAEVRQ